MSLSISTAIPGRITPGDCRKFVTANVVRQDRFQAALPAHRYAVAGVERTGSPRGFVHRLNNIAVLMRIYDIKRRMFSERAQ